MGVTNADDMLLSALGATLIVGGWLWRDKKQ
jgi:hypothetical protein